MCESSEFRGRNLHVSRAVKLILAGAMLSAAGVAMAQDGAASETGDSAEPVEEVLVTGFRASLNRALDAKQEQVGAIDMIAAEDIADFPDLNLAESLQRLPGVVIARDAGEGRQISVRGLGPQFARVRINGVEAMSANGGTDAAGGTNRGRNFDFNTFSSELFSNIVVRKTAAAEVEEGSLGATVDLRTARPFDYDDLVLAGSLQIGYNDLNEDSDPRAALLFSKKVRARCAGRRAAASARSMPLIHSSIPRNRPWPRSTPRSGRAFRATTSTNTSSSASASPPRCNSCPPRTPTSVSTRCTPSTTQSVTRYSSRRRCSARRARQPSAT